MAGRMPKNREFFHTLADVLGLHGAAFANAIGKKPSNVSQYLSGTKKVGRKTLASAVHRVGEWQVQVFQELRPVPETFSKLPTASGIYALYDSTGSLLYVGQALNLRAEIRQTLNRQTNFPVRLGPKLTRKDYPKYRSLTHFLSVYEVPSKRLRHNLEALLLRVLPNQSHNNKLGKFL